MQVNNGWTGGQYSLFRMLFGTYLFVHFVQLVPWAAEVYSNQGMLPDGAASPLLRIFPNLLAFADGPWVVSGMLVAGALFSLCFAAGWFDRVSAVSIWYLLACLFGRNPLTNNPALPYVGVLLLAHAILPPSPFGAVSARKRTDPAGGWQMPTSVFSVVWILMALGYSYSGYTKLVSPSWTDGSAMRHLLENPLARPTLLRELMLGLPAWMLQAATWGALALELSFAPLALFRPLRRWIWLAMLGMHCGLIVLIDFADLSLGMVMLHLFTFVPAWIPACKAKAQEVLFYDGGCGLCHKSIRFLLAEDPPGALHYAPLDSETFRQRVPLELQHNLPDSLLLLDENGQVHTRSTGIMIALSRLGGVWRLIGGALRLVPRGLRDMLYDGIARVRLRLFSKPSDVCPILPHELRARFLVGLLLVAFAPLSLAQELPRIRNLPDFSWAGYHSGSRPLPSRKPTIEVIDGKIQAALDQAARSGGVVRLPAGRFTLNKVLRISASGVVLRGAGSGKTTLYCPRPLAEMIKPSKQWSWSGGMIQVAPRWGRSQTVASVVAPSPAGSLRLTIKASLKLVVGEWLLLEWFNDTGKDTLLDHLYGGVVGRKWMGKELQQATGARVKEWIQVVSIKGNQLTIAQPLRIDLRPAWRPRLSRRPLLQEVGIEGLTIAFPRTTYPGHLKERGYNGISISSLVNGWVRDVRTINADSGIFIGSCRYVTVRDIVLRGRRMHHPLSVSWAADCLITRWRIEAPHRHGTTISWAAHGNVFSHGWGNALAMDAHRAASFQNLHSQIVVAHGRRPLSPFRSGGSRPRGPHTASRNVYWNIYNQYPQASGKRASILGHAEWPRGIFVGWRGNRPLKFEPVRNMKQQIVALNQRLEVQDLHAWQLARRLKKK